MNIPNLPTDNLYKFCAIAGLVILGLSLYVPYQMLWQNIAAEIALRREIKEIYTEFDIIKKEKELDDLLIRLDQSTFKNEERDKNVNVHKDKKSDETLAIKKAIDNLRNEISEFKRVRLKQGELEYNFDSLKKSMHRVDEILYYCKFLGIIGILLTYFGFRNWYLKIQVYQDAIIKKQAQEAGIEIKKTKAK